MIVRPLPVSSLALVTTQNLKPMREALGAHYALPWPYW